MDYFLYKNIKGSTGVLYNGQGIEGGEEFFYKFYDTEIKNTYLLL